MRFAGLALILLGMSLALQAQELNFKKRFDHNLGSAGWSVFPHRSAQNSQELIALNRRTLQVEVLNATTGETLLQDKLDTTARDPQLLQTLSSKTGDFVIALAKLDHRVELHTVGSDVSFEVEMEQAPIALQLTELQAGEIFLTVASRNKVAVYARGPHGLQLQQKMTSLKAVREVQTLKSASNRLLVEILDTDGKLHVVEIDPSAETSRELFNLVTRAPQVDGLSTSKGDFIVAQMDQQAVSFYVDSRQNAPPVRIPLAPELGSSGWLKGSGGRQWFAALQDENGVASVSIYDAYNPTQPPVRLGAADASAIDNVGILSAKGKIFYYFVRDHKALYLETSDLVSIVPTKASEQISEVQSMPNVNGHKPIAVMLEGKNGSRLQVVELN